jgi:hypothetical protein
VDTTRQCGPCTVCCTVMAVVELNKSNYEHCRHLAESCTIYETRPQSCCDWGCNWLHGMLGDDERRRPDNLGLIVTFDSRGGKELLTAYEVWDGAAKSPKVSYLLQKLGRKQPVILVHPSHLIEVLSPDPAEREELTALFVTHQRTGD